MNGNTGTSGSNYGYKVSASGVSGQLDRPAQKSVQPVELAKLEGKLEGDCGHVCKRLSGFQLDGLVSCKQASLEVGGSKDTVHNMYTSYACAVIEGLNIAEMVTADRVVSRISVYSPVEDYCGEHTFDITGSYFENLKIAGHKIDFKLATYQFHELNSYSKFTKAYAEKKADDCLLFSKLGDLRDEKLNELVAEYDALSEISGMITTWRKDTQRTAQTHYCSAASHLNLQDYTGPRSELAGYGAIICIPKFGVIRLAEIEINKDIRTLKMLRVDMCSTGHGSTTTGTTVGGGGPIITTVTD